MLEYSGFLFERITLYTIDVIMRSEEKFEQLNMKTLNGNKMKKK